MDTVPTINASLKWGKFFWFFFSKKNKPFFCEQSCESAPDEKKQETSSVFSTPLKCSPSS